MDEFLKELEDRILRLQVKSSHPGEFDKSVAWLQGYRYALADAQGVVRKARKGLKAQEEERRHSEETMNMYLRRQAEERHRWDMEHDMNYRDWMMNDR